MKKKLQCFIALAFDRKDVEIYYKSLSKLLQELNINPIRVDKINHNENIEKKLIESLRQCDFCIADLTYSRPSVYFEAGFAEGLGKDVIYTSRNDHFKHKETDPEGNLRIHFDVSTRNIVRWDKYDKLFEQKLKKRISPIAIKIIKRQSVNFKKNQSIKKFASRSQAQKKFILLSLCENLLQANKYQIEESEWSWYIAGFKMLGNRKSVVIFITYDDVKVTSARINSFERLLDFDQGFRGIDFSEMKDILVVFNSINSISSAQVQKALRDANSLLEPNVYICKNVLLKKVVKYVFIDSIKYEDEFIERVIKHTSLNGPLKKILLPDFKKLRLTQRRNINPNRYGHI